MPLRPAAAALALAVLAGAGCYDSGSPPKTPRQNTSCQAIDCASANAQCGSIPDGCGGVLQCGDCPEGQTCGGGGPNVCGAASCQPTGCEQAGATCGPLGDGCGNVVDCGSCPTGQTCGAGGVANACATPPCTPTTCAAAKAGCGTIPDGCGGTLECGGCPTGQTCGGGGAANTCGTAPCTPTTCEALGARCGPVANGCGGVLQCGDCPEGQSCGGGGVQNQCGAPACVPTTCQALGASCGRVANGCGGTLDCGACKANETCTENACTCAPKTCADLGAACGTPPDGCGGTLFCGGCPPGQTCGGGGTANQCGAPPVQQGGATRWLLDTGGAGDEYVAGVAARPDGTLVALTVVGGTAGHPDALGVIWIGADGKTLGDPKPVTFPVKGSVEVGPDPVAVSPLGNVFVAFQAACEAEGCTQVGGRDVAGGVLVKLGAGGALEWRHDLPGGVASNVAADPSGGAVVAEGKADVQAFVTVRKLDAAGGEQWRWSGAEDARTALACDEDGNVVVGQALRVTKLDPRGQELWHQDLSGGGAATFVTAVGARRGAPVFAAGIYDGPLSLGGASVVVPEGAAQAAFVAALSGANGQPAWLRASGPAAFQRPGGAGADVDLAADPGGFAALLVGRGGCDLRIERWNGDGGQAWARGVSAPGCANAAVFPTAIELAPGHDVAVSGGFAIPVDFGGGAVQGKGGRDGFVLDLVP